MLLPHPSTYLTSESKCGQEFLSEGGLREWDPLHIAYAFINKSTVLMTNQLPKWVDRNRPLHIVCIVTKLFPNYALNSRKKKSKALFIALLNNEKLSVVGILV